jgi:uncharacterized membrane protein
MRSVRRRGYIDAARGIAVLLMIEAHATDAWTRFAVRRSVPFRDVTILGGFAAPMFLFLAGVGVVLSATRTAARTGSRANATDAIVRRGLEIFILAFLFRIQAFIVSPGNHPVALFRVDILNVMGPAIAAAGLLWALGARAIWRLALFAMAAIAFTMVTPIVRTAPGVELLPLWLQWYVRPAGELTVFTLFPWAGFVFAGGAAGVAIAESTGEREERRVLTGFAVAGAALMAIGFAAAARPSIYTSSSFWTSSPTWFAIRAGILLIALSAIYLVAAAAERASVSLRPLERLGEHSLFIYWIHVELVYGYASWLWRHRLPLWGTAIAYVLFCALMYRAIGWRDRIVASWRSRGGVSPRTETATA